MFHDPNATVQRIHHQPPMLSSGDPKHLLRVAAYARVSTLSENQADSYEIQKAYYETLIRTDPNKIYANKHYYVFKSTDEVTELMTGLTAIKIMIFMALIRHRSQNIFLTVC